MTHINKSALVPYSAEQMYNLVDNIPAYSEFLPWCQDSRIVRREKSNVDVTELRLGYGPMHSTFATRNIYLINCEIKMDLVEGPFEFLEGSWHFEPMPGEGCRMSLDLKFEFSQHHLEVMFNQMFKMAMATLVHAFRDRAKDLYGE